MGAYWGEMKGLMAEMWRVHGGDVEGSWGGVVAHGGDMVAH